MIDPNLITTTRVGELPSQPFSLTDLIPHEVGVDLKSGTVQQLLDLLRPLVGKLQFEVIQLDVTTQYITDNFDATGLGKNLCLGFAICNGNNGTKNRDGRSSIGYGTSYNFVGVFGGFADATLVEHNHTLKYGSNGGGTKYPETPYITDTLAGDMEPTGYAGSSATNKNYHPYIVTLTIMKL